MTSRTPIHGLEVDSALKRFLDEQVLPAVGVAPGPQSMRASVTSMTAASNGSTPTSRDDRR